MKTCVRIVIAGLMTVLVPGNAVDSNGFELTNRLVLQQGAVPTINGVPTGGVYTGTVDTYVDQQNPTTPFGEATVLLMCKGDNITYTNSQSAFIRFDGFGSFLPPDSVIVRAGLYLTSAGEPDTSGTVGGKIRYLTSAWDTNTIYNSNTNGGADGLPANVLIAWMDAAPLTLWTSNQVRSVDITALAQVWHSGALSNWGMAFARGTDGGTLARQRRVFSSKYGVVSSRPKLEVDFVAPSWERTYLYSDLLLTNASAIQGTPIHNNATNYYSINQYTPWGFDTNIFVMSVGSVYGTIDAPARALLKVNMSDPALANLAKTGEIDPAKPVLVTAQLQVNLVPGMRRVPTALTLWACNQVWIPTQASGSLRDGTNAWADAWITTDISNVSSNLGTNTVDPILRTGTLRWDVTPVIQGYVDGSNNCGFVLGHANSADPNNAEMTVVRSISSVYRPLRPALVLQYKQYRPRGTVVLIQ